VKLQPVNNTRQIDSVIYALEQTLVSEQVLRPAVSSVTLKITILHACIARDFTWITLPGARVDPLRNNLDDFFLPAIRRLVWSTFAR
jgi:hypothetical protein